MNSPMNSVVIRNYTRNDRPALRKISYDTSFLGKAEELFDEPEILADALTLYFTDNEPKSCFVAEIEGRVVGYLIGAKSQQEMSRVEWFKIYPHLVWTGLLHGVFFKKKTFCFLAGLFLSSLKGEFKSPDFSDQYPAILHINVAQDFRGLGVGQKLIEVYCQYLQKNGVAGVHVATMVESAKQFFERCGFGVLYMTNRSYLHYYFHKNIPIYILGKKI